MRFVSANIKNRQHAINAALELKPGAAVFTEASKIDEVLEKKDEGRFRVIQARGMPDAERGDEVALLVRDSLKSEGTVIKRVSKQVDQFERLAPERWLVSERIRHPELGLVAVFGFHPNAAGPFHDKDRNHPLIHEFWHSINELDVEIGRAREDGFAVLLGSDVNWREVWDKPWSPWHVFNKYHLEVRVEGIDVMACSRRLTIENFKVLPKGRIGPDHPALVGDAVRRA